jgi:hypothetical protein
VKNRALGLWRVVGSGELQSSSQSRVEFAGILPAQESVGLWGVDEGQDGDGDTDGFGAVAGAGGLQALLQRAEGGVAHVNEGQTGGITSQTLDAR